jgi:hypothetical protein
VSGRCGPPEHANNNVLTTSALSETLSFINDFMVYLVSLLEREVSPAGQEMGARHPPLLYKDTSRFAVEAEIDKACESQT